MTSPPPAEPLVRPAHPLRPWLVGLIFWMVLIPLAIRPRHSGNVWSRYLTIESVVERGTLAVERSPLLRATGSPDLVKYDRHFYSDKPPVLSVLASPAYGVVRLGGWRFVTVPNGFVVVNAVLVGLFAAAGSALALVGLRMILQAVPLAPLAADLLTLGFGFGSLLLVYGVTFNNHSVAAGLLSLAFAWVAVGRPSRRLALASGVLASLAAVIDLPAGGALWIALGAWLVVRDRTLPLSYLLGSVGPLALHVGLQTSISGSPWPAEMDPKAFEYVGSYWASEAGRWVEPGPRWQFGLELLVGPQGWLTVTPVLVLGWIGLVRAAFRPNHPLRGPAWALGLACLTVVGFYVWGVRRTDFAGQSFGTRHLLALTPPLFAFAVDLVARSGKTWAWALLVALMAWGTVYAQAGQRDPWSRIERRADPELKWVGRLTPYPWTSYRR